MMKGVNENGYCTGPNATLINKYSDSLTPNFAEDINFSCRQRLNFAELAS